MRLTTAILTLALAGPAVAGVANVQIKEAPMDYDSCAEFLGDRVEISKIEHEEVATIEREGGEGPGSQFVVEFARGSHRERVSCWEDSMTVESWDEVD